MKTKEENIYYDYENNKYAIKVTIEKAIDEMTKEARNQYDALAVFALSQRIPLSQITSQNVSIHFKSFAKKIITHVIYKELDLITEEQQELYNLIQKQQEKRKQKVAENLINELREVVKKMKNENFVFDCMIDTGSFEYFHSLDIELDDGNVIVFTFDE